MTNDETPARYFSDYRNPIDGLFNNLKVAYEDNAEMSFKIEEPKDKGFLIRVGGLYGYVSYFHMPWQYPLLKYWHNVAEYLKDHVFYGKIHKLDVKNNSIFVDAKDQKFKNLEPEEYENYSAIVLNKTDYGLIVDLGHHFDWKNGSMMGLVHKSNMMDPADYENANEGDTIQVFLQGYNQSQQMVLGDNLDRGKWYTRDIHRWVGTIQKVLVAVDEEGRQTFYVNGQHKGDISLSTAGYSRSKEVVEQYLSGLQHGEVIQCEVVKVNKQRNGFVLRLYGF